MTEAERVAAFRERVGLEQLVDVHTHFMPHSVMKKVWAYFDAAGPLVAREWPIAYKEDEATRLELLRSFRVRAFTSMLYAHKPGMTRWLNDWAAEFAANTPDCIQTATLFAEPSAFDDVQHALGQGARIFKCHLQVGGYDPNDPQLDDAWALLAERRIPIVTHCGSGPVAGAFTGPGPMATLLARHPHLRIVVAHLGMPEYSQFLDLAEQYENVLLDTTMAFSPFIERDMPFPAADRPRLAALQDRVLLGTDFPNIPYAYAEALESLERTGLGSGWLRAVCYENGVRLFGL